MNMPWIKIYGSIAGRWEGLFWCCQSLTKRPAVPEINAGIFMLIQTICDCKI
jgi:hypothetical protein